MRTSVAWLALLGCSSHDKPPPDAPREFDVVSAQVFSTFAIAVTFTDPPNPTEAAVIANYSFEPALALRGNSIIMGSTVTLGTLQQEGVTYQMTVAGVTRMADGVPLTAATTTFTGHTPFNVASAVSTSVQSVVLTFDAAPDPTQAMTLSHYRISDPYQLGLAGTPQLAGNSVTLATAAQSPLAYDLDVFQVTRASDHEPLYVIAATFTGADHCTDGVADGDETDMDCGGPTCSARCTSGQACSVPGDCTSGTCSSLICS